MWDDIKDKRIKGLRQNRIHKQSKPFGERERERERERKTLREGRTAGAGAEEATSQRQISDGDEWWPIYRLASTIYKDFVPFFILVTVREKKREKERNTLREGRREHRSRGRSPICDEGRATTATTSELRRRGDVTVGLLGFGFYLCIWEFFFF